MSEPTRIGDILLRRELVDPHTLRRALAEQESRGQRLVSMLITQTLIELDDGARALAEQFKVPAVLERDWDNRSAKIATVLSAEQARAWAVIPLSRDDAGTLLVAARDPSPALQAAIENLVGGPVKLAVGPAIYIERIIKSVYKGPAATGKPELPELDATRTPTRPQVAEPTSGPHVIARGRPSRETANPNRRPTREMPTPELPPELLEPTPPPAQPPSPHVVARESKSATPHVIAREPSNPLDENRRPTRQIPAAALAELAEAPEPTAAEDDDVVFDLIGPTPPAQAPVNEPEPEPAGPPSIAISRAAPRAIPPIDDSWDSGTGESAIPASPPPSPDAVIAAKRAALAASMFGEEHTSLGLPPTRAPAPRAPSPPVEEAIATPRTSTSAAFADRPMISLTDDQPAIIAAIDGAEPIPPAVTMPPPIKDPAIARTRTPPPPPPGASRAGAPPSALPLAPKPIPSVVKPAPEAPVTITSGLTNAPPVRSMTPAAGIPVAPKKTPPVGIPIDTREKTVTPTESPFDEMIETVPVDSPRPPTAPGTPSDQPVAKEIERALSRATADRIVIKHLAERWKSALIVSIDGDNVRPTRAHGPKLNAIDRLVLAFSGSSILRVTRDTATIAMATTRPNTVDQLLELIGVPATAAPVIVEQGKPVAIIAAGEPIVDLPTAIQDMIALASALGAAYRRFR